VVEDTSEWVTGWGLVEASVEAEVGGEAGLDGVIPMLGVGPDMVCPMAIPLEGTEDTDLVIRTTAMAWDIPMVNSHGKNGR